MRGLANDFTKRGITANPVVTRSDKYAWQSPLNLKKRTPRHLGATSHQAAWENPGILTGAVLFFNKRMIRVLSLARQLLWTAGQYRNLAKENLSVLATRAVKIPSRLALQLAIGAAAALHPLGDGLWLSFE